MINLLFAAYTGDVSALRRYVPGRVGERLTYVHEAASGHLAIGRLTSLACPSNIKDPS